MAHDVFISYSSQDKAVADAACAALESRRIRCWIAPRDVMPGVPYGELLTEALEASRLLLLVLSAGANSSTHVMREVETAVDKGIPILPMRVQDVLPSGSLRYYLKAIHWLDALTPPLERHLQALADTVQRLLDRKDSKGGTQPPPPVDGDAEAARAVELFGKGDFTGAAAALERALAADVRRHGREELYAMLGNAYYNLDRLDDSITAQRKALEINPRHHPAWVNLGVSLRLKGEMDEAERCYLKALEIEPGYPELHSSLGTLYIMKDDGPKAVAALQKAIELNPQQATAHGNLAAAYALVGRFDDAEASLRRAILFGYKNSQAIRERIEAARAQATGGKAAPSPAAVASEGDAEAVRGVEAYNRGEFAEALHAFQRALESGNLTTYPPEELQTMVGNALGDLGRLDEAIAAHRRSIDLNPRYHKPWVHLGIAYRQLGMYDDAEASYRRALELQPDYAELHSSLGVLYIFKEEGAKAMASFQRAIELNPQLATAHGNLAAAYAMVGRFDEAEASLGRATSLGYTNVQAIRERIDALKVDESRRRGNR